jgi:hypothetical protein
MPARFVASVLVLASLCAAPAILAQQEPLPAAVRAAADGISAAALARDLDYLASDALRGRDTGSPGFDAAATYIERRLRAAGLTPAGDAGTFRQHYDLRQLRVDADKAVIDIDGRRFVFGKDFVFRSFAGAIDATVPVVYVGHGWHAPARGLRPWAGVDVRGKLVLAHGPRAMPDGRDIKQIGRVSVGASSVFAEAAARGALGVLFLTASDPKADWQALQHANLVRREIEPAVPSAYAAIPVTSLLLAPPAAAALMAGERIDAAALVARGERGDYPRSFQLARRIRVRVPVASVANDRPYNVVAILHGSDPVRKREFVTVASHLDGAVGTREVDGDGIYNSADDNATGSAATLAIAEQMAKGPRPARSVIFVWDSGEERGLWGTRRFVRDPPVPIAQIVAHVNVDMIGATRAPDTADAHSADAAGPNEVFLIGPGVLSPTIDALLERVNASYQRMTFNRRDDRPESEFFYPRTDAGPYLERGILTIGFTTGSHPRYHLPADEARHLDPAKMQAVARTVFASVWAIATTSERPRIEREIPGSVPRYGGKPAAITRAAPLTQTPTTVVPTDPARFRLFLLIGQSNMAGRGKLETIDAVPIPRVLMLDRNRAWVPAIDPMHYDKPVAGVGLGRSFAAGIVDAAPAVTVGLIPAAVGGSPIDAWQPGAFYGPTNSHPWDDAIARARAAMQAGTLQAILWHQGESDATPELAPAYEAKLHALIARLRATLNSPDVPFIVGQLGRYPDVPWDDARQMVDAAHRALPSKVAHTAFVSSERLVHGGDRIHFDSAALRELGRRYADALARLARTDTR